MAIEIHEIKLGLGRHVGYILATKPAVLLEYSKVGQPAYPPSLSTASLIVHDVL